MKTIELYLLLILFFNIFVTETSLPSSIDTNYLDTTSSTIDSINLDTTETTTILTNSDNIDSTETDIADTTTIPDSKETNIEDTISTTDLKETNLEDTISTTDLKETNTADTTLITDSKETNLVDTTKITDSKDTNFADITTTDLKETNSADTTKITDSKETNLADTTKITDSKETNLVDTTSITELKETNLVDTTSTTDSKETNLADTTSTTDTKETNLADTTSTTNSKETNLADTTSTTDSKETNLADTTSTTNSKETNLVDTTSTTNSKETNLADTTSTTNSKETNLDTTSTTDSKETNLDTTSTTDSTNGNQTDPSFPSTTIKPRLILVGFGGFQRPIRVLVIFKVYFKRFLIKISSKFLYFTVNIFYTRRLRYLEEVKQNSTCILISPEDNDNMAYNCSVPVEENKDFTMSANDDFVFENLSPDLIISSYANSTMKSLSSLINDPYEGGFLTLTNSTLTQDDMTFRIEGYLMEDESLNDKQVTLSLDQNGDGNLVNVTCNVNDKGNKKYELVCTSDKKIKAHLEGVMGKTSGKPLLIHMANNTKDLVDLKLPINNYNSKNSSNGLSGGAIAGIVIACCVALIAAAIVAYFCVRDPKPPVQEATALELYTSKESGNNI